LFVRTFVRQRWNPRLLREEAVLESQKKDENVEEDGLKLLFVETSSVG
jgi:hypothetical protein